MKDETAGKSLSNVKAQAPIDTVSATLSEIVPKAIGDTLSYVPRGAPVKTLAETLADVEA